MNKRKRVAWHKHLKKAKRFEEKTQAAKVAAAPQRPAAKR